LEVVLDDTSLPKEGEASVGVARQYGGALGKVANCQALVTWHYYGPRVHFPLLGEVYLPQSGITDPAQLDRAGVPEGKRVFREKWRLVVELLDRVSEECTYEAIVMDAGYEELRPFLHALDQREQCFVAQIPESQCFWPATVALEERAKPSGRPRLFPMIADPQAQPLSAKAWRAQAGARTLRWQKVPLRL
jgi:SRSO17 transposase